MPAMAQRATELGLTTLCLTDHCDLLSLEGERTLTYDWAAVEQERKKMLDAFGTKLDLLRADPNVSFEADCPGTVSGGATSCTYGMNYQSVIGRGTVRFVEGGEKLTALQALMQHYHCPDLPFEPEMVEHTTVLALDVAAMTGKRRTSF